MPVKHIKEEMRKRMKRKKTSSDHASTCERVRFKMSIRRKKGIPEAEIKREKQTSNKGKHRREEGLSMFATHKGREVVGERDLPMKVGRSLCEHRGHRENDGEDGHWVWRKHVFLPIHRNN